MISLSLSILFSVILVVLFKYFEKYKVDTLQAIVVNYFTAVCTGYLFVQDSASTVLSKPWNWFPWALLMGTLFISLFVIIGKSVQKAGITLTSVSNKMSLVIPVSMGFLLHGDTFSATKGVSIVLAIAAVILSSAKENDGDNKAHFEWKYPLIIFLGSGILDTLMKYIQNNVLNPEAHEIFLVILFLTAGCIGFAWVISLVLMKKTKIELRNVIGGVLLGIPNYFSIYFLLDALHSSGLQSSALFPINNVGTVLLSAVVALLLFKERLSKKNFLGLGFAILSIILMAQFA